MLDIRLVCVEDDLKALGFRKISSQTKYYYPKSTKTYYLPSKPPSLWNRFIAFQKTYENSTAYIENIAKELARADIVGLSSMTEHSETVKDIIAAIRRLNSKTYIVWGGVHCIIDPEDAIKHADAICTGEGESAFIDFLQKYEKGEDFTSINNFWFNHQKTIIKNEFYPLHTNEQLDSFPFLEYGNGEELIYTREKGLEPLTKKHYLLFHGPVYNTIWSIGCPFRCSYCGNSKFIENDEKYRSLRHPSVKYIVGEIEQAIKIHPFINVIIFHDDSFMAIPSKILKEFSEEYQKRIKVPFAVLGVIPNYVREDKYEILLAGGLNRVRMGIQSGSNRMLKFYKRPSSRSTIIDAINVINKYKKYTVSPTYDFIVDNPIETEEDVKDTLKLLYEIPFPFTINPFSLRVMPNTELNNQFKQLNINHLDMTSTYIKLTPTYANTLLYLLCFFKPPRFIFNLLLKKAKPYHYKQKLCPALYQLLRVTWLFSRALSHLKHMDFSYLPGQVGYILHKMGFLTLWKRLLVRKFSNSLS